MPTKVEISYKTIVFIFLFLALIWAVLQILDIILLVFVSFIFMSALRPLIDKLEKYRIPRVFGILITYILLIALMVIMGSTMIPLVVSQSVKLVDVFPRYVTALAPMLKVDLQVLTQQVGPLGENLFKVTLGIFSNILTLFTILVITFYFLLDRNHLEKFLNDVSGTEMASSISHILHKVEERLGGWVRSQLILALTIGLMSYIGLTLLRIDYALPLAIIAGSLEIVPIIGPIISAIPAILIGLTVSPLMGLATLALYFIIQQAEAHLIVPQVMKRAFGLPPVVTILVLMVGSRLDGIAGALFAVPIVLSIQTVISEIVKGKSEN